MNLTDKTIVNVLARSSGAILLLGSSIVMARHLSKADFGSFLQVMLVVNTALMLSSFGLPHSIYYFYHRAINRPQFLLRILLMSFAIGLIGAASVFSLRTWLASWFNNASLGEYLLLASAMIFTRGTSQFREPILISSERLGLNAVYTLVSDTLFYAPTLLGPFFTVSLVVIFRLMFFATLFDLVFFMVICLWQIVNNQSGGHPRVMAGTPVTKVRLWDQLKYAAPIGLSSYLGILGRQIDQYLVSIFFVPADFAVYSRGSIRIPVLGDLQFIINDLQMPKYVKSYSKGDNVSFLKIFHKSIVKVAKIKYPAFCFLFASAPSLIEILYTRTYHAAIPVFRTYLIMLLTTVTVYGIAPRASGKTISITISVLIGILTNVVLSLMLLPVLGALGAAVGTIVASTAAAGYLLFVSAGLLKVSLARIFPWRNLGKLLLISAVASLPLYLIQFLIHPQAIVLGIALLAVEMIVYMICWVCLMARYKLFDAADIGVISRWLGIDLRKFMPSLRDVY